MTLTNTTIAFTPKEYTGIGSATTNMMRIIGGAIGPVLTTVILASATVSITVDNVEKSYPSPVTFNILFGLGAVMTIECVFLAIRMKHLATKMSIVVLFIDRYSPIMMSESYDISIVSSKAQFNFFLHLMPHPCYIPSRQKYRIFVFDVYLTFLF
jgi:hypothetical protein